MEISAELLVAIWALPAISTSSIQLQQWFAMETKVNKGKTWLALKSLQECRIGGKMMIQPSTQNKLSRPKSQLPPNLLHDLNKAISKAEPKTR